LRIIFNHAAFFYQKYYKLSDLNDHLCLEDFGELDA